MALRARVHIYLVSALEADLNTDTAEINNDVSTFSDACILNYLPLDPAAAPYNARYYPLIRPRPTSAAAVGPRYDPLTEAKTTNEDCPSLRDTTHSPWLAGQEQYPQIRPFDPVKGSPIHQNEAIQKEELSPVWCCDGACGGIRSGFSIPPPAASRNRAVSN
jgi:hypothetical protein